LEEEAENILSKIKSSRMLATKWLISVQVVTVVDWITSDLMPSELEQPQITGATKKKR
jgi:hypothetical protein